MASRGTTFNPIQDAANIGVEEMKETVADLERNGFSTDEKIRRLKQKGEQVKDTFNKKVDEVVDKAARKAPKPNATSQEKEQYDTYLNEVLVMMDTVSKWIGTLWERIWKAINEIIDLFCRCVTNVVNFASKIWDGIKNWWNKLW